MNLANFSRTKNACSGYPLTHLDNKGISDTGENHNYMRVITKCRNKNLITNSPEVILPDYSLTQDTNRVLLNLNFLLTPIARTANIFCHLQSGSIISIG